VSAQHTPGEWRAAPWTCHAAITVLVADPAAITGQSVIAECESEADACLIAHAPDLLAMVKRLVAEALQDSEGAPGIVALADAQELITRATGGAL
jgi:hypothetical protein